MRENVLEQVICAGFGGQGVMLLGRLIAATALRDGLEVSWLPSYGPEMRGGTANCQVVLSSRPIGSPLISRTADTVLALNLPSMRKFEEELRPEGLLVYNSSLIDCDPERKDIRCAPIPANEIANEIGNLKTANIVMLGAYAELTGLLQPEGIIEVLEEMFGVGKSHFIPINRKALDRGVQAGRALHVRT
ncbi:MAG: 2-oxoacid:ferredoxin oxidoreductase subunit gamma [Spirochaetaceae bacterium]|nr:MAG: 2-oxoacid:ferredoxin oxidoreductase subunit gamma [Spirochaetaceae bacterium]